MRKADTFGYWTVKGELKALKELGKRANGVESEVTEEDIRWVKERVRRHNEEMCGEYLKVAVYLAFFLCLGALAWASAKLTTPLIILLIILGVWLFRLTR